MDPTSVHPLAHQTILVTGAAKRIGKILALEAARLGANLVLHYNSSGAEVERTAQEIRQLGVEVHTWQVDLNQPERLGGLFEQVTAWGPLTGLVNNASIFNDVGYAQTSLDEWNSHLNINLTAPFLLSQLFSLQLPSAYTGRIINLLDWRALRPGADHFPYSVSKAGLAALTRSLAAALAPRIVVNGLALGAILPPSSGPSHPKLLDSVPAGRWAEVQEVESAFRFLLTGPFYITGEIIHLDGGRHLV